MMQIANKRELQQTVFNHLPDSDFKDFMNPYKQCTAKPYYFFVIDARDCNWTRTQNHLVLKRTLNHLAKLAK